METPAQPPEERQLSLLDDQFDLDIRITPLRRSRTQDSRIVAGTGGWECYSVDPSCGATCACSTVETCNQHLEECGFPFTFPGNYCEDETDGCGDPQTSTCDCDADTDHNCDD